jgi:hypothetical protein
VGVRWEIQTATGAPGAIAVVQIAGGGAPEIESALRALGIEPVGPGRAGLRDLMGVDTGVVTRWTPGSAHLMPHGGPRVVRRLAAAIAERLGPAQGVPDRERFPEAGSLLEARVLGAVARAASPLALRLLLDQARRWPAGTHDLEDPPPVRGGEAPPELSRLLEPALVVAVGAANIGKSALVNALAGRPVSIVADEPGTTRDHVGVLLDCAGLVVRYVDTPGVRADAAPVEEEARAIAGELLEPADLVLACGDAHHAPPENAYGATSLRVAVRSDLGRAAWAPAVSVSALTGDGLPELVAAIRERLVPETALRDPRPWRFWGAAR